jgi:hypothetical protein
MKTMATQLRESNYSCNDQAMHIHIYYSNILDKALHSKGFGSVWLVPNEEALLGTVGTTPMVTFNEWGEILNEKGQVQFAVHQYKTHSVLSKVVWWRFGWMAEVGKNAVPPVAAMVEDKSWLSTEKEDEKKEDEKKKDGKEGEVEHGSSSSHNATSEEHTDVKGEKSEHEHAHSEKPLDPHAPKDESYLPRFNLENMSKDSCWDPSLLCSCKYEDCQMYYYY